jgi:hypothetical protein
MTNSNTIQLHGHVYRRDPAVGRFQIPLDDLGDLRMADIPVHSHFEVLGIPWPEAPVEAEMWIMNSGDDLCIYGGASIPTTPQSASRAMARLRQAFEQHNPYERRQTLQFRCDDYPEQGMKANVFINLTFVERPDTLVRSAITPFVTGFARLRKPQIHLFICHASEDKAVVRRLVQFIERHGVAVWLDEYEIRVGESIVQRINQGIEEASHMVVVLSSHSATRPWVTKELSAALMRQLVQRSIQVLPLRLDDCPLPALLADIKYADCREDTEAGFQQLLDAVL